MSELDPRWANGIVSSTTVSGTAARILGANPKRVAIVFSAADSVRYTVSTEVSPVIDGGLTVQANGTPLEVRADLHGNCTTKPWYAITTAGTPTIGILEVFIDD